MILRWLRPPATSSFGEFKPLFPSWWERYQVEFHIGLWYAGSSLSNPLLSTCPCWDMIASCWCQCCIPAPRMPPSHLLTSAFSHCLHPGPSPPGSFPWWQGPHYFLLLWVPFIPVDQFKLKLNADFLNLPNMNTFVIWKYSELSLHWADFSSWMGYQPNM